MPYIEGQTLQGILAANGPLEIDAALTMVREIGAAISFAHNHDVIHRDVKPSNVLLEQDSGRWLITDFGVAHVTSEIDTALTQSGAAIGTPAYMAPEQLGNAGRVDSRSDLYSLAMTAVESLTGQRPDPLATQVELAASLKDARPELKSTLVRTLVAPLAHAPSERPASVAEWTRSLAIAASTRRRITTRAAGAALLVAATLFLWLLPRSGSGPVVSTVAVLPFEVTGTASGLDLSAVAPLAFEWHVQRLPGHRTVGAAALRDAEFRRFGSVTGAIADRIEIATRMGAEQVVEGWADVRRDSVTLRIAVHRADGSSDPASFERSGPIGELDDLVGDLVVASFAARIAAEMSGTTARALPRGIDAISEYLAGDQAFRHADYSGAIAHFDRVMELDSSYALAPFKRMLAVVHSIRPTEVRNELRAALAATTAREGDLDPGSAGLLEGYRVLFTEGDIQRSGQIFRGVVSDHPDLFDGWFVLGYFQYRLGALLGISLAEARTSFNQVLARNPDFAPAQANLALIALAENDRSGAEQHLERYLALDSTSDWADLARSADSLVFRQHLAPAIIASLPNRPDLYLEILALAGAELNPPGGARAIAESAAREIWARAATPEATTVTFRILMAYLLGSARYASAQDFFDGATRLPREERDRWIVLSHISALPELADSGAAAAAVTRMVDRTGSGTIADRATDLWLAARWFFDSNSDVYRSLLRRLTGLTPNGENPLARGLLADLEARANLARGDTAAALDRWEAAINSYAVDQMFVGLVASLWPVRVAYADAALATGDLEKAAQVTQTFVRMVSVIDQVAWPEATGVRARTALAQGNPATAAAAYDQLLRIVARPDGSGTFITEDLQRFRDGLGQPE
jgi:tetratricopeptide (TPR) repeat protein